MLNKTNAVEISEQSKALLYGDKRDVSRAYRRFLSRVVGTGVIVQRFTDEGAQLDAAGLKNHKDYASKVLLACNAYSEEEGFALGTTFASKQKGAITVVENRFVVSLDIETASLGELQRCARLVSVRANALKLFALNPQAELHSVTKAAEKERKQTQQRIQAAQDKRFYEIVMRSRKTA